VRALVTGGSGFVGSNLVRRLLAEGHEVHVLLRSDAPRWRLEGLERQLRCHHAQLEDAQAVERALLDARPDWVFHLAVYGAYSFQTGLLPMVRTNVLGTANLLAAALAAGCRAFVNTGSSSEYGDRDHAPTEEEGVYPNSYYAVTKASATWLCREAARQHQAHIPTLRLYSVFGPFEDPRRLMPRLVAHALRGRWPPLASPQVVRDFVYIDDVVDAYLLAVRTPGQEPGAIYNVGTGAQTALAQLAEIAVKLFGLPEPPPWGAHPGHAWDTRVWVAQPEHARRILGWKPQIPLEQGLRAMAAWMEQHLDRYPLESAAAA